MRNFLKTVLILAIVTLSTMAFTLKPIENENQVLVNQDGITIPEGVKAIIEAKCMNCHKPDARNEKAREKLQWVKVPEMNKEQQEHFVAEMFEVLEEEKMPPARMVERNPQIKLTEEETKTLLAWMEKEEKRIKG